MKHQLAVLAVVSLLSVNVAADTIPVYTIVDDGVNVWFDPRLNVQGPLVYPPAGLEWLEGDALRILTEPNGLVLHINLPLAVTSGDGLPLVIFAHNTPGGSFDFGGPLQRIPLIPVSDPLDFRDVRGWLEVSIIGAVPEGSSTVVLLGMALVGVIGCGKIPRKRSVVHASATCDPETTLS